MGNFVDNIKKNLRIGIEKTEEYGKIGKLKVDILGIQHNLDKALKDLGELAYSSIKSTKKTVLDDDKKVKDLVKKVDNFKADIALKEKEIQSVKKEHEAAETKTGKTESKPQSATKTKAKEKSTSPKAAPKAKPAAKTVSKAKTTIKKPASKTKSPS